jgi:hypothetical protein
MLAGNCPRAAASQNRIPRRAGRRRYVTQADAQTIELRRLDDRVRRNYPQAKNYKLEKLPHRPASHRLLASWHTGPPVHLSLNHAQWLGLCPEREDHSTAESQLRVSSRDSNRDLFLHKIGRTCFAQDRSLFGILPHVSQPVICDTVLGAPADQIVRSILPSGRLPPRPLFSNQ